MLVLALWAGAVSALWVGVIWGRELQRTAPEVFLGAAPLVGRDFRDGWDWRFGWGLIGAGVVAALVIGALANGWFERARLRVVVAATSISAGAFALLLALTDGRDGVLYGAADEHEYLANLSIAPPAGEFVRTFVERIDDYTVHARGHPPGFIVLLELIDGLGLTGPWPVAMVSLVSTIALPAAVLVAVWAIGGHGWARRAAPFLVVAPYALWMVTSADAFFTALGAWGVALVALAMRRSRRVAIAYGGAGGVLLGLLMFMTYGGAVYLLLPLTITVVAWRRGQPGVLPAVVGAVAAAAIVTAAWAVAGFWWFDGAAATRREYWDGSAQFRIWNYFIFANLAVALIAIGPATLAGLTKLRDRRIWTLAGGALLALFVANVSQLSKAEVERIWLLFYPWLVVAGAALVAPIEVRRLTVGPAARGAAWVAAQALTAILLQAALVSKW